MWFGSNCRPTIPSRGTARSCASGSLRGLAATAAPHVKRSAASAKVPQVPNDDAQSNGK
jgi:hypothetical protein